jgi:hypothetical protein
MKKIIYFFYFLIISWHPPLAGQNSLNENTDPWAISFSFSPKIDISPPYYAPNDNFVPAFCLKADHRIFTKFSYSIGVVYNNWILNTERLIFDGLGSEISTNKILIFEFPIQLNYHLSGSNKMFDPYLMTSFNNSYYHQDYYGEAYYGLPDDGEFSIKRSKYCLFYNLGLGAYINLSSSLSIITEASVGFGLVYYTQRYRFIEGQVGVRYTLK